MDSEFATLVDIVLSRGVRYRDLINEIHAAVLSEYKRRYPKGPIDTAVFVDEQSGQVRLMSGNKDDVTPQDFSDSAAQIARLTVIKHIQTAETAPLIVKTAPAKKHSLAVFFMQFIFWGYNGLYLIFITFFLIGLLNPELRGNLFELAKELGYIRTFLLAALFATPFLTIVYVLREKIHKQPGSLAKIFFLLEMPLVVLLYIPVNLPLQLTPIMWFFTGMVMLTPLVLYSYDAVSQKASASLLTLRLCIQQLVLTASAYLTLLWAFFAPLILGAIASELFRGLFNPYSYSGMREIVYTPSFTDMIGKVIIFALGMLAIIVVSFLVLIPFLVTFIFLRAFLETRRQMGEAYPETHVRNANIVFAVITLILVLALSYQPDVNRYLKRLAELPQATTFAERETIAREILPQENAVKQSILDMYNARRRFLFTKDDDSLSRGYAEVFHVDTSLADFVQKTFLTLAYPFVYQGSTENYSDAAKKFEYVFGYYPQENNYKPTEQKNVRVTEQTIKVTTDKLNPLATVSITETYENKTWNNQEVVYEFSLPNGAVITDLNLGPNLEFPGNIAPKGAARKVYEQELNRRRDPALLEQTGPRQYRLRVFPIPGKNDTATLNGKLQKVQYSYVVGVAPNGIPLPNFTKKFNIETQNYRKSVFINGRDQSLGRNDDKFIKDSPMLDNNICDTSRYQGSVKLGSTTAKIVPHSERNNSFSSLCSGIFDGAANNLSGYKIALLYDVSYGNKDDSFDKTVKSALKNNNLLKNNSFDLYFYNDYLSERKSITTEALSNFKPVYFGKSDVSEALRNVTYDYDLVIVVNGSKTFDKNKSLHIAAPVYFVHTQGVPQYSQELTYDIFRNRGQVSDSVADALTNFALIKQPTFTKNETLYVGPYWSIVTDTPILMKHFDTTAGIAPQPFEIMPSLPSPPPIDLSGWEEITTSPDNPLSYAVAHAYLEQKLSVFPYDPLNNMPFLDAANTFAVKTHIISPYSSLIALVNETQKQNLERESYNYDRYQEETQMPTPISNPVFESPMFDTMGPLMGSSLKSALVPTIGGGGGTLNIPSPAIGGGGGLDLFGVGLLGFDLPFLFIGFTAVVFIAGLTYYLILIIRKKPTH